MKRESRKPDKLFLITCLVFLLLACWNTSLGQGASSVHGVVTDPQGNVVPGATVTLTNTAKNFTRTQTTNDSGSFAFTLIPPDQYTVDVQAPGFKKAVRTDVAALVSKATELNVQLDIGNVSETVSLCSTVGDV